MKFIQSIFSDVDGQASSKRVGTFIVLALIVAITIGVTFGSAKFSDAIWTDLIYTFLAGMGLITSEKFTKRGIRNELDKTQQP